MTYLNALDKTFLFRVFTQSGKQECEYVATSSVYYKFSNNLQAQLEKS